MGPPAGGRLEVCRRYKEASNFIYHLRQGDAGRAGRGCGRRRGWVCRAAARVTDPEAHDLPRAALAPAVPGALPVHGPCVPDGDLLHDVCRHLPGHGHARHDACDAFVHEARLPVSRRPAALMVPRHLPPVLHGRGRSLALDPHRPRRGRQQQHARGARRWRQQRARIAGARS